ncbi:uncharacterized protein C8R40DRAFT_1110275 [Lentinula edodes]|uniref:uncharacterized protein n=1 Tax=Lentinula edodes TaxID=5353 RepID=UPI001E8CF11C|nr:uncharacterized protein C8R40DRAFT_1110275 [Lentinula edodes]KAH7874275.1 hypothetical protein C8R40DRAFT_1110275 [Lentinula edodes]
MLMISAFHQSILPRNWTFLMWCLHLFCFEGSHSPPIASGMPCTHSRRVLNLRCTKQGAVWCGPRQSLRRGR